MGFDIHVIPNLPELIQQLVASTFLYFFLRHFLFKPVTEYLAKRKTYIEEGVRKTEEAEEKLMTIEKEYDQKMLEAKKESTAIISGARNYGEEIKSKAVEESKLLAKQEYDKGMKQLENERQKAMKSLNDEIVNIALNAAEKVLREKSDSERDKKMVQDMINDLEKSYEWCSS